MKKDIAERWSSDLRSGASHQGFGKLFDGECYCALGRLVVVLGKSFVKTYDGEYKVEGTTSSRLLPTEIRNLAGLSFDGAGRVSMRNDAPRPESFSQIANFIDKNYESL